DIPQSTMHKSWWECNKCKREFNTTFSRIQCNQSCPYCINKTEGKFLDFLKETFFSSDENINIIYQYKADWCKSLETGKYYRFDFCIINNNIKILIELHGKQHVEQVMNWLDKDIQRKRDVYKMKKAIENEHYVIVMEQEMIW